MIKLMGIVTELGLTEEVKPKKGDVVIDKYTGEEGEVRNVTRNGYARVAYKSRGITLDVVPFDMLTPATEKSRAALGVRGRGPNVRITTVRKNVWISSY